MTEVDAVMPEGVATLSIPSETTAKPTNSASVKSRMDVSPKMDRKCQEISETLPQAMEVDGVDTEEDDSQITTSSENGITTGAGGDDSKMSEQTPITSAEDSKESEEENESSEPLLKTNTISENSSNACDGVSQNLFCKPKSDKSEDSVPNVENSLNSKDCDNSLSNVVASPERAKKSIAADSNDHNLNQDESSISKVSAEEVVNKSVDAANDVGEPMDTTVNVSESEDPLAPSVLQKENGVASIVKKKLQSDAGGIVDLDDDSDDEECTSTAANKTQHAEMTSNGNQAKDTTNKSNFVCSDSDGAVVIGSDSENEANESAMNTSKKIANDKTETQIIDDDDDDCVVIEDDTPASTINDLTKRKSLAMDSANNSDDSQPPSKRQRNAHQSGVVSQITIKDPRSLMPQEATTKKPADMVGVYPINIAPAPTPVLMQGPPKLVPMGSAANMAMPGLPGLSSSSNLLPGLTDDMFVLEAPSFIVPYIYEKPPSDNLREIVKDIEDKYKLTKEDLADADKSDEFDMMTEQNKQEEKSGKKKKKRRGGDSPDDSWSEGTDEDDDEDEDDSEAETRTKVLIKEASDDLSALKVAIKPAAAVLQQSPIDGNNATATKPGQENYFESPLGKFFMDIGVGLVQEFVQSDLIRLQKRKMRKSLGKNITEFERAIAALSGNVEASKKKNAAFKFTMKRCEFCNFKSESALAMANHYETPHMNGQLYKCNFCTFEIRNATEIVYHMEAMHNIKARLIKPLPYHQCPNCGFEDNGKAKLSRHQPVCAKKFRPELNLSPPTDWEAPAKIPRIKPRHGLVGTATAYQAMAAQAAAQKAALASIQQQQQQVAQARSMQAAAIAAQNAANKIRGRPPTMTQKGPNGNAMLRGPNQVRNPMATNVVLPNNYQLPSGQLIQQTANALAKKTLSGQPSISITPLPRQSAAPQTTSPSTSKLPPAGMKPGQTVPPGGNKAQFVICEICDGYIKDLEQLRNHMQWMHKVKIHPKMIYNRPPLNCQKCQFRFFTDQGLERHLLGSHGLVTSSMQEAANKGKDAGRCPVCGRMYQWKLLNHVSRDHHMTLKPAHLSYKCTVCTATFGMYKQFETHVYTAHSTVAKKAMDGKKNNAASGIGASMGSSGSQRSSLGATNDSLLKPLKINDEITIIPQPASKPRITNMESHVID